MMNTKRVMTGDFQSINQLGVYENSPHPTLSRGEREPQPGAMTLEVGRRYAGKICEWLGGMCERMEIAGSIRRGRAMVNDVDIVCIPKVEEHKDMLGAVIGRSNYLFDFLVDYVKGRNPLGSKGRLPHFISGGEREGKQVLLQLPKCQLDLWFADAETFGTRLLCRTGSKEHNIWLAERAGARGMHWDPYAGLSRVDRAEAVEASSEEEIYAALGLEWIEPKNREAGWLSRNIDSGL
jgi:DNA polymerase/3'-5' exonuclease PolX